MNDFHANILVCFKLCNRRRGEYCGVSGLKATAQAHGGQCPHPRGNQFELRASSLPVIRRRDAVVGQASDRGAGAQKPQTGCGCGGEMLAAARRRVELLEPICRACPARVRIESRENPLRVGVVCKEAPGCCGGGPGTIDLVHGACIELKHEEAIARWKQECAGAIEGGGTCR